MFSSILYTSVDGKHHELKPSVEFGEYSIRGSGRPNGEWRLMDYETGLGVVNRFNVNEVAVCHVKWGPGSVALELWSEERPVSKDTPLSITHEYDLIDIHSNE
jgi:alpha-glucosidase